MSPRDDPFLALPPPAPGNAKNVRLPTVVPPFGMRRGTVAALAIASIPIPLPLMGFGAFLLGKAVWSSTAERGSGQGFWIGAVARVAWVASLLSLCSIPFRFGPVPLLAASLCLAAFSMSFSSHLSLLTRPRSGRPAGLFWTGQVAAVAFLTGAACVVTAYTLAAGLLVYGFLTLVFALGAFGYGFVVAYQIASFWSSQDRALYTALGSTRLRGVPATWMPWGRQWEGAERGVKWRVIAECSRLPIAIRVEVAIPGFPSLQIRKRVEGERGGVTLADPVLAATIQASGVDDVVMDAMAIDGPELVLPLVHGRGAVVDYGVIRIDLAAGPPWDRPWEWIEPVLLEAIELAHSLESRRRHAVPKTDEVVRELEALSQRIGVTQ